MHRLLQFIQILLQNRRILKTVDKVGKVSNILCEGSNAIGVDLLDFEGKWKCL
jgi:hypothetical protein